MKYKLISVHEETTNDGELITILLNYSEDFEFKDSVVGIFDNKTKIYLFFNTIDDLYKYKYHSVRTMQRAYLSESDFDDYFDNGSDKIFSNILIFTK